MCVSVNVDWSLKVWLTVDVVKFNIVHSPASKRRLPCFGFVKCSERECRFEWNSFYETETILTELCALLGKSNWNLIIQVLRAKKKSAKAKNECNQQGVQKLTKFRGVKFKLNKVCQKISWSGNFALAIRIVHRLVWTVAEGRAKPTSHICVAAIAFSLVNWSTVKINWIEFR